MIEGPCVRSQIGARTRNPSTLHPLKEHTMSDQGTTDYLRNAELQDLANALKDHQRRAVDVVAPATAIRMSSGNIVVSGVDPVMDDNGVTDVNGLYRPTRVGLEGIATRLEIGTKYLRRCHTDNVPLADANVNGWTGHESNADRKFLLRLLRSDDPSGDAIDGVVRAFLSDSYKTIDNFDVLLATLSGMQSAGIVDPLISADLTERRMVVKVTCPQIAAHAPELLKDYRNPFGDGERALGNWTPDMVARAAGTEGMGYKPGTEPILFAGFQISNSETGGGAFRITPRLEVRVCRNGLTIVAESSKEIHLGAKLDSGVIEWSEATRQANIQLVMAQTGDAVRKFLSPEYLAKKVTTLEKNAGIPVKPADAIEVIASVSKVCGFSQSEQDSILNMFMAGQQFTAGGVMQAVTAAAQTLSGDDAYEMEGNAFKALAAAGSAARKA